MTGTDEPIHGLDILREEQLRRLEEIFDEHWGMPVIVHGAPGSGKTALAALFAARFPGKTIIVPGLDRGVDVLLDEIPRDSRSLLVVDEVDRVALSALRELVGRIADERPMAGLLMTSNTLLTFDRSTIGLEMPPLSNEQILALLVSQTDIASPRRLKRLVNLLAGNAVAAEEASRRLAAGMPLERLVEWLESGKLTIARDSQGRALPEGSAERDRLDLAVDEISEALIKELAERPQLLYDLDPRKFEQLIAELYRRRGFEATLTPASGDEGVDIYVVSRNDLGQTLWVVQAKRHAAENRIKAGVVRELYGTVMAKNASAGILVTTSFFQPGAVKLEREFEYRINLKDYIALQEMLRWPQT